jgi:hypothetical protein
MTVFTTLAIAPVFVLIFLKWNYLRLEEERFKAMYGSLYQNMDTSRSSRYCFNVAFLIRRVIYAFCINDMIFNLSDSSLLLNIMLQVILSSALIIYVLVAKPFIEAKDNYIEIFNETSIFILFVIPLAALIIDENLLIA